MRTAHFECRARPSSAIRRNLSILDLRVSPWMVLDPELRPGYICLDGITAASEKQGNRKSGRSTAARGELGSIGLFPTPGGNRSRTWGRREGDGRRRVFFSA